MGQYHVLVNYDKKEVVTPHELGLGLKQWEHIGFEGGTLADAMYILTMTSPARGGGDLPETAISGRWAGDRCFVYGDYTAASDLPDGMYESISGKLETEFEEIGSLVATEMGKVFNFKMSGEGWKRRINIEEGVEV
jgi:hypothetical protein